VAVLLEVARVLINHPPPQPVMIALTAREEDGLIGARALAARYHQQVRFAIALDLLGSSGALTLNGAGKLIRAAQLRWLAQAAERAGVTVDAPLLHRTLSRLQPTLERSDHGAFTAFHIPAIHLYHRGADDELIDLTYHSRYDVAERVLPGKLEEIGKLLLAITEQAPPLTDDGDGNWLPIGGSVVIPRWVLIGLQSALAVFALGFGVVLLRRRFPPRQRGVGLLVAFAQVALVAMAVISLERFSAAGHPAPWSHDPLRTIVALGLVAAGMFSAALGMVRRLLGIRGERRFLFAAIAYFLVIGGAAAALDGWELAWIWLLPAALLALAPRLGRFGWAALLVAVVPTCALLGPDHLREAMFQGFFPPALPLAGWIILHALPHALAAIWWYGPRPRPGPGREAISLALSVAAIALGTSLLVTLRPLCTPERFDLAGLSCERGADLGSPASR
jgi:Peptidase family M28